MVCKIKEYAILHLCDKLDKLGIDYEVEHHGYSTKMIRIYGRHMFISDLEDIEMAIMFV